MIFLRREDIRDNSLNCLVIAFLFMYIFPITFWITYLYIIENRSVEYEKETKTYCFSLFTVDLIFLLSGSWGIRTPGTGTRTAV